MMKPDDVTPATILAQALSVVVWGASATLKCTGDVLSWIGEQGLILVDKNQPKKSN
jgi:hypothetical protein